MAVAVVNCALTESTRGGSKRKDAVVSPQNVHSTVEQASGQGEFKSWRCVFWIACW